jgi:hypothetical protein
VPWLANLKEAANKKKLSTLSHPNNLIKKVKENCRNYRAKTKNERIITVGFQFSA